MKKLILTLTLLNLASLLYAQQNKEVPFTMGDRERIIRLEERVNALNQRIDDLRSEMKAEMEAMRREIEFLRTLILWGFGILFGAIGILIGFIIWDRRTTLSPVVREIREVKQVLREISKEDPKVEEVLKKFGWL